MLEINVQEKQIGEYRYYARPMPPLMALSLLGDLQKVVTTSLKQESSTDISVGEVIAGIGGRLDGSVLMSFAERILNKDYVSVELITERGKETFPLDKLRQEEVFTGHIKDMIEVMWFVLEVNYKDFFGLLQNLSGTAMLALKK